MPRLAPILLLEALLAGTVACGSGEGGDGGEAGTSGSTGGGSTGPSTGTDSTEGTTGTSETATTDGSGSGGMMVDLGGETTGSTTDATGGSPTESTGGGATDSTGSMTGSTGGLPDDCGMPPVSFATQIQPIFNANCTGCHNSSGTAGLALVADMAYDELVDVPASQCGSRVRVAPTDPMASYILNKLTGVDMCSGERMPRGGDALSSADLGLIDTWICQGALDN